MDREHHKQVVRIARAKAEAGERLNDDELKAVLKDECAADYEMITSDMKALRDQPDRQNPVRYTQGTADSLRGAISKLLQMMAVSRFHHIRKREALEDRVAALEAIVKPRVRRPAGSSPA